MSPVRFYALVVLGIAVLIAMPFLAISYPWTLLITFPIVFAWSVWVINHYWRWVRALGTNPATKAVSTQDRPS